MAVGLIPKGLQTILCIPCHLLRMAKDKRLGLEFEWWPLAIEW